MNKIVQWLLVFCLAAGLRAAHAQQTLKQKDPVQKYHTGQELFLKSLYGGAREQFESFVKECPHHLLAVNARYYIGICALYQGQPDAEDLISTFIAEHPEHSKTGEANLEMGTYYYNSKNYDKAIEYFDKVNWSLLTKSKQLEGKFRIGYSYFSKKDFGKALEYFNESKKSDNRYQYASTYYAAYIEFKNGEYDQALADLDKAESNDEFKALVPQLKTNVLYRKGDYDALIQYAKPIADGGEKILGLYEITLLLAEGYFQKEEYEQAYTYFQKAEKLQSTAPSRDVVYRYGYTCYKAKMWDNATKQFKPIAGNKDTIGQAAAYYLGLSFLVMEQKEQALLAFTQATSSDFLPSIKEESEFLVGKISFDLQRYTQATQQLKHFIETYPKSQHQEEAGGLLGDAFLNGKDYVAAIEYLEKLRYKSIRTNMAYQKLTYYRGVELYNQSQFREAIAFFERSNTNPFSKDILIDSWYWIAESYSALKEYNKALDAYTQVLKSNMDDQVYRARYGTGYAYYNTKEYEKAIPQFKVFTDQWEEGGNVNYYKDALVRLADLYYVTKKYSLAITYYDKALSARYSEPDYIIFQKGVVYNLSNQAGKATENFQLIISKYPASVYYDHALFQQAQLYMEASEYEKAVATYTKVITRKDPNGYIPYALQKRALANFNLKKYAEAKEDYKTLLSRYPQHPVGESALIGMQEILALEGSSDQFDQYLEEYKNANPEQKGLRELEYTNALSQYSNQRYDQSAKNFEQFITKYPDHAQAGDALFYLAESNYRLKKYTEAASGYEKVLANKDKYFNRALGRLAEIENTKGNSSKAVEYFSMLNQYATGKKDQFVAWTGLMENYFKLAKMDSSERYADQILAHGNPILDAENKALLYKSKIYIQRAQYTEATDYLVQLMNNNKDAYAAEANYLLAEVQYTQKEYQQSLETLYSLNENFATYTDWVNKGFLLIAENLVASNELFQAKATLQSIIDHCKDPAIVEKAKTRLEQLNSK